MSSRDPDDWMWRRAVEMIEESERLQRHFFQVRAPRGRRPTWEPPVDLFEHGGRLNVVVALPGVPRERIEVGVQAGVLVIGGERPVADGLCRAVVHRLEIPYGRFERRIALPAGTWEVDGLQARDGCLELTLRRIG